MTRSSCKINEVDGNEPRSSTEKVKCDEEETSSCERPKAGARQSKEEAFRYVGETGGWYISRNTQQGHRSHRYRATSEEKSEWSAQNPPNDDNEKCSVVEKSPKVCKTKAVTHIGNAHIKSHRKTNIRITYHSPKQDTVLMIRPKVLDNDMRNSFFLQLPVI
ncbi:hypothetical protein KIN20_029959 [Parelaphostrongylus tenuis]|uniref:Uncharacterized protein n=1 Tax=Parelaphostrongylus tenuis TaxID=148309 RepID=A0AAD5R3I3_PARTN|nr:hypothetical protein KIN20_029959 [Parelaphostrongylus tenuis]